MPEGARRLPEQFELFEQPKRPTPEKKKRVEMKPVEKKEAEKDWRAEFDRRYTEFDAEFDRIDDMGRPTDVFVRGEGAALVDALPKDHPLRESLAEAAGSADSGRFYAVVAQIQDSKH